MIYFDLFLNSRTATWELFLKWVVESKRANKIAEFGLKFTAYKRNLFQVSIDEKHFECRAESDFNTFGTIVTISQSEQDVVFLLGLMAQGSVTFSTDREK